MNFLFEIGHPGHVHLYRNLASELKKKGHEVTIICRETPVILQLLTYYQLPYTITGKKKDGLILKYLFQLSHLLNTYRVAKKYHSQIGIGVSMTLPILSKFGLIRSIILDDDDRDATPVFAFFAGLSDTLLTPMSLSADKRGKNRINYNGFHELAYLHPNHFTPDATVLNKLDLSNGEKFFLLRFNSFKAHHDEGENGMTYDQKLNLIQYLEPHGRIFISTESEIEPDFKKYALHTAPENIHSILYYATLYIGESQTMTSEAAILGTPSLKCNTFAGRLSVPNELEEKYGLCYSYLPADFNKMLLKVDQLLSINELKTEWQVRRKRMLSEKIDLTAFLVWFVENYPESIKIMKENSENQYKFK